MSLTKITCILGKVSSSTEGVVVDSSKIHGNSSKWIFDVEHQLSELSPAGEVLNFTNNLLFRVQLLDFRSGKPKPKGLLSPHASPLDIIAAQTFIFFPEPNDLVIAVHVADTLLIEGPSFRYRVTVDALHSMHR